jgi:hypothetical protein
MRKPFLTAAAAALCLMAAPHMAAAQSTTPAATPAAAAPAPAPEAATPEKLALVHRMFGAMHIDAMMQGVMQQMTRALIEGLKKAHPELTGADSAKMQKAMTIVIQVDQDYMPRILDATAQAYAEVFTTEELTAMDNFYESPVGQSMLAKTPQVMARVMPKVAGFMPDMMAETQKRVCAEIDCSAKKDAAKTS